MNNFPSSSSSSSPRSAVPSIRIHGADDPSALFDSGDMFPPDINLFLDDASLYACAHGLQSDYFPPHPVLNPPSELEAISELSHLTITRQPFLTDFGVSLPYPIILHENTSADQGLAPSTLGSPIPSPTSSLVSSLSPSSFYDPLAPSDTELLHSPSPDIPDGHIFWASYEQSHQSSESLVPHPSFDPFPPGLSGTGPHRARAKSSPPRHGPVASKAMLEANGRRRRHPPQFECPECRQTFTALFSLKRHLQSHTGERPFACGIPGCSQRFYNSSDCKRHEKSKKRHKDL